ncbi:MAG: single-stranded DNA-binding protein [Sphaerochaetaceae bacterium]|nr:single-stranded DNA-binding protein [Sphaerochaetaceae bacterium]
MNDLNTVLIEGRLVRDPDLRTFATGQMCRFSIACARFYFDKDKRWVQDTSFLSVEVWGAAAKVCSDVLKKGRSVRVVGRIRQRTWKDNMEKNREYICIIAEHIEFKPEKKNDAAFPESPTKMDSAMTERLRQEEAANAEEAIAYANEEPEEVKVEETETQLNSDAEEEEKEEQGKEEEPF